MPGVSEKNVGDERDSKTKLEERRKQILDASATLFAQKSYHATSMDDIVKGTGLSKGTLYWYFKSKKEIMLGLIERSLEEAKAQMSLILEDKITFAVKIQAIMAYSIDTTNCPPSDDSRTQQMLLNTEFWRQALVDPEVNAGLTEIYDWQTRLGERLVQEAIEKGEIGEIDSTVLSNLVIAVLDGISLRWLLNPKGIDLTKVSDTFQEILFSWLEKK